MRPTDVARSVVCVFVCVGHTGELCRNGWTDRHAVWWDDSCGPKEPCNRWGWSRSPTEMGNFGGCPANWKALGVSSGCGVCSRSKNDYSILNIGMIARLLQTTAILRTGRYHITFSLVKNPPPCDAAFRQNYLTACYRSAYMPYGLRIMYLCVQTPKQIELVLA